MPNFKDDHATLTVHILDLQNRRVFNSILINSWEDNDYFYALRSRLNLKEFYYFYINDTNELENIRRRFPGARISHGINKVFCD